MQTCPQSNIGLATPCEYRRPGPQQRPPATRIRKWRLCLRSNRATVFKPASYTGFRTAANSVDDAADGGVRLKYDRPTPPAVLACVHAAAGAYPSRIDCLRRAHESGTDSDLWWEFLLRGCSPNDERHALHDHSCARTVQTLWSTKGRGLIALTAWHMSPATRD